MSAALSLKQTIYQLPNESLLEVLSKYFLSKSHDFSSQTTQKAYKCFECCILVDQAKYCAGFGRTESEASLNAVRIALESIIDSGDSENLSKVLIQPQAKCELSNMLKSINCSEYLVSLQTEKIQYADIEKYNLETLKKIFPLGPALKVFNFFHPSESSELAKLQEMNEVLNN